MNIIISYSIVISNKTIIITTFTLYFYLLKNFFILSLTLLNTIFHYAKMEKISNCNLWRET